MARVQAQTQAPMFGSTAASCHGSMCCEEQAPLVSRREQARTKRRHSLDLHWRDDELCWRIQQLGCARRVPMKALAILKTPAITHEYRHRHFH